MTAGVPALPLGADPLIAEAKERARRRRVAALAAIAFAFLAAGLVLAFRLSSTPGARVLRVTGISVRIPSGWFVTRRPLTATADPRQRFVVSSYRIPASGFSNNMPSTYVPSGDGVLADVQEEFLAAPRSAFKPLGRLRLGRLGPMKTFAGRRWDEFLFRVDGRQFYAFVWIGRDAPHAERNALLSILNGMTAK